MKTEDGRELRDIIEVGVLVLESISDVKYQKRKGSNITKEKLILAMERAIITNKTLYKELGYNHKSDFSRAIRKVFTNIDDRPTYISWKHYILYLAEYKCCPKCKKVFLLEDFGTNGWCKICHNKSSKIYKQENQIILAKKAKIYREENKETITEKGKIYYQDNKNKIADKNKIYNQENKDILAEKRFKKRKATTIHIINVMIREGKIKEAECSRCGYKENWAALDFHHINPELERPEWAYDGMGNKIGPGKYILKYGAEEAEKRYLVEMNNLELLCSNCHREHHNPKLKLPEYIA